MLGHVNARAAAISGVLAAAAVAAIALARWDVAKVPPAVESTRAVRITVRNDAGLPSSQVVVRDAARVRGLVEALGVDGHAPAACPPDYAEAEVGLVLSGADVYAKRNVYVFGKSSVVSVTSAGCRVGPPADEAAMSQEIARAASEAADGGR